MQVPLPTAVTTPEEETVATAGLSVVHVSFAPFLSAGEIVAFRVYFVPFVSASVPLLSLTEMKPLPLSEPLSEPVSSSVSTTVTLHLATKSPSSVTHEIYAVPVPTAVTLPADETFATALLLVFHVTPV